MRGAQSMCTGGAYIREMELACFETTALGASDGHKLCNVVNLLACACAYVYLPVTRLSAASGPTAKCVALSILSKHTATCVTHVGLDN